MELALRLVDNVTVTVIYGIVFTLHHSCRLGNVDCVSFCWDPPVIVC